MKSGSIILVAEKAFFVKKANKDNETAWKCTLQKWNKKNNQQGMSVKQVKYVPTF